METGMKIDISLNLDSPKLRRNSSIDLTSLLFYSETVTVKEKSPDKKGIIDKKYKFYSYNSRFNDSEIMVKCQGVI